VTGRATGHSWRCCSGPSSTGRPGWRKRRELPARFLVKAHAGHGSPSRRDPQVTGGGLIDEKFDRDPAPPGVRARLVPDLGQPARAVGHGSTALVPLAPGRRSSSPGPLQASQPPRCSPLVLYTYAGNDRSATASACTPAMSSSGESRANPSTRPSRASRRALKCETGSMCRPRAAAA